MTTVSTSCSCGSVSADVTLGSTDITDVQVRIGQLAATARPDQRLVTVGLGSCVGVALIDERAGVYALAHVFLPEEPDAGPKSGAGPATYASTVVPALVRRVQELGGGATSTRLVAVIAGGARMFSSARSTTADIGERNVTAVTRGLEDAGIRIVARLTGGTHGRTIRVEPGCAPRVTVREVGRTEVDVWQGLTRVAPAVDHAAAA
ncbi:MAG: CheD, stimulates methylation of protein [Thermoleophilia bacterium]|nr:CheD, stimulates methylation of protein [Thermoleophilia bacterium]